MAAIVSIIVKAAFDARGLSTEGLKKVLKARLLAALAAVAPV